MTETTYEGILVINKEKGFTSHDVVAKLRGILHTRKIGHTGTLDPDATGVLPVCVGRATRLCEFFTEKQKEYETVVLLGQETDTYDTSGTVLAEKEVKVSEEEVREAVASFLGDQMQVPPMYSAIKIDGKKLYELAREGITVERPARPVTFYTLDILEIDLPRVRIRVQCSKGTYIRSLCHDLGEKLGCGGCMEFLVRTQTGPFSMADARTLSQVQALAEEGKLAEHFLGIEEVLGAYPKVSTDAFGDRLLLNGNPIDPSFVQNAPKPSDGLRVRMSLSDQRFVGLYRYDEKKGRYQPEKMFL